MPKHRRCASKQSPLTKDHVERSGSDRPRNGSSRSRAPGRNEMSLLLTSPARGCVAAFQLLREAVLQRVQEVAELGNVADVDRGAPIAGTGFEFHQVFRLAVVEACANGAAEVIDLCGHLIRGAGAGGEELGCVVP